MATAGNLVGIVVRRVVWLVVILAVAYGGITLYRHQQVKKAAAVPQFYAVPASMGPVTVSVSGVGTIQAVTTQNVTPLTAGRVSKIDVTLGQSVKAGDPLYELQDTSGLTQQVESAQAALDQAQAQLQSLTDPAANQDPRALTQQQIKVQQAQLSLQQAQLNLSRDQSNATQNASVTTPIDGTVQSVNVTAGQQVNSGTPIATILPSGDPTITVPVPEEDLLFLPVGTAAMVTIPALQQVVPGTVTARATTPSGQITLNSAGVPTSGAGGGAGATTQSLYPLTVRLSQAIPGAPQNAAVLVAFTPQNNPPASYQWSDTGSITYPTPMTVTAQQSGVVGDLLTQGQAVKAGQSVASVTNSASATTIQQDQIALQQDQLNLQQAQVSLDQLQHPQPGSADQVAAQQATIASDEQSLAQKQQQLGELTVRAPIEGKVVTINANPGDNVTTSTAGVVLQAAAGLETVAPIDELDIGKVKVGMPAQISITAFPNAQYTGKVVQIAPSATNQNGVSTYQVTVSLDKQDNLLPGMSATATIAVNAVTNALRVPAQAVTVAPNGTSGVVRVMDSGVPRPVRVGVGLVSTDWVQITSGLQVGQPVVAGQASTSTGNTAALLRGGFGGGGFGGGGFAVRAGGGAGRAGGGGGGRG